MSIFEVVNTQVRSPMKPLQTLLVSASVVALITVYVFDAVTDLFARYFTMELEVCRHYNDADATVMQVTDQYFPFDWSQYKNDARRFGSSYAEFLAFKHNIPLHVFEHESKQGSLEKFMQTGRGGASMYFPSCNVKFTRKKLNEIRGKVASASGYRPSTISYGCGKDESACWGPCLEGDEVRHPRDVGHISARRELRLVAEFGIGEQDVPKP